MSTFLNLSRKDRKKIERANKNLALTKNLVKNNKALIKEFLELVPGSIQLKQYPAFWQEYRSVDYTETIQNLKEVSEFVRYMRDKNLYGEEAIDIEDYDVDCNESDVIERYIRKGNKTTFKIPKSWFYSLKLSQIFDTNICEQVQVFEDFQYGWKNQYTGLEFKCDRLEFWQPQGGDHFHCIVVGSNLTYNQLDRFVYEVEKYWSMKYNDKRGEDLAKKLKTSDFQDSNLKYYRGKVLFEDDQEKLSKLRELYLKDGEDDLLQQIVKSSHRGVGELAQVPLEVLKDWIEILEKIEFNSYGSSWIDFFIMDWEAFGPDLIPLRENRISLRNLYHRGNTKLLNSSIVGVTGGREAPEEELVWLKEQIKLLPKGTVVMTGLADGADKVATETALECGLSVIGVVPYGMKNHAINKRIVKRILKSKGLILSKSNGRNSATPESYISRDKIIAQADALIATNGGNGTNATIAFASANSVPIKRYGEDEEVIKEKAGITPDIPAELRSIMYQYFAKLDICEVIDALKGQYKKTLDFYEPTPMDEVRTSYEEFFDVKKDHKAVYDKHQEYVVAKKYRGYKPWWIEEDINEVFPGLQEVLNKSVNHKKALQSDLKKLQYKIIEVGKERMKPDYDGESLEELNKYLRNKYLSLKEEIANHH